MLRLFDRSRIDLDQFLPAGVIGNGDTREVIVGPRLEIAAGERENLDLHPLQFFKRQLLEERPPRVGEVMLHRIAQGEKVAARFFEPVAKRDQLFPTVGRDEPVVFQVARQFLGVRQAEIGRVAIGPDERMDFLGVATGRSILFPSINAHRPGVAHFNRDDPWPRIEAEEQGVFLETHSPLDLHRSLRLEGGRRSGVMLGSAQSRTGTAANFTDHVRIARIPEEAAHRCCLCHGNHEYNEPKNAAQPIEISSAHGIFPAP